MEIRLTKKEASKLLIERVVKDTQPLHGLGDCFFNVKWEGDSVTITIREHQSKDAAPAAIGAGE